MKLSRDAKKVLDQHIRKNPVRVAELEEMREVIAAMPDDRKLIYRNVESNPLGDMHRYSIHIRIQHLLTFTTFLLLAFTGLPIYFNESFWAVPFNSALGGIEITRLIHRTLAAVMVFAMVYHVVTLMMGTTILLMQRRFQLSRTIIPIMKDLRDMKDDAAYFAGKREQRPEMDKFMYKQKIHYFAAAFGNSVMVLSGSAFLFPDLWASILPNGAAYFFQEFMRLAHPHEALLALIVIAFWHWYNVHLAPGRFPMQWTYLTGRITREHQIEEHFLEYLRNLADLPEERQTLRETLRAKRLEQTNGLDAEDTAFFDELRSHLIATNDSDDPLTEGAR